MKTLLAMILTFSGFGTQAKESQTSCVHSKTEFQCVKYVRNYDGDTVTFNIPGVHSLIGDKISVRVDGIDTPEVRTKDQCEKEKARTAKRLVKNILSRAKRIDLKNVKRGKYFRVVAEVVADGQNLKDLLIKNQLARLYDGGTKSKASWCDDERLPASGAEETNK